MDKNARRRLRRASAEKRLRYSVRKFSAGVASVAVAAFMFFGGNVVSADTLATADSSSTSTEKTTSVPDSGKNSRMDDSESAVGKDSTVTTVAESNAVSSATSTVSSTSAEDSSSKVEDKNVKSEATSQVSKASVATSQSTAATQSEARVSPATSATAESTAVSSEAAADETAAVEPKVSVEKAASQAASLATASKTPNEIARSKANSTLAAAQREVDKGYSGFRKAGESGFRSSTSQTGKVTVTKENFLDYFKLNGSATYDKDNGIVTLTPDETSKGGNFSLNSKINMNQSFKLIGAVNLGDKTQAKGGADGIGFAFHTGNITDLGASGGNLGIGGLRNATGFKLDTYRNLYVPPKGGRFDTNDATFFEYGWAEDPNLGQFGSWVNTTFKKIKGQNGEYDRWWAETDAGSAQPLDSSDIDGKFHDFTIQYDGATKELTVTYRSNLGEKQWKKTVNSPEELMSMVVTASTGGNKNLQQFKIESFDFYQGASVGVRYEDEQGREIAEGSVTYPQGAFKGKTYTTEQKSIPNYDFVGLKNGSLPTSGSLTDWGNNGTVTYVYRQGKESVTDPAKLNSKVTRTIKYEYADGETAGRPALKAPVTQEATFTRTGERNRVTGVETFGAWTPATKELAQEDTPVVTGFVADKANVAAKTVTPDDKDSEEVVQYKKLGSYVPNVPDGLPKVPNLPYPNDPTDPTKPGTDLPLIPHVPGTTPVGPDGTTPLTPKDPSDPSKGYNPPPIPNDPTQDTPISYVKDGQKAIITFVDQDDNNKEVGKVVESGKSGEPIGTTNYAARLKELTDKGYEVVNDEFAGPKNFDNDNKKDQQFVVTLRQGKDPITDPAKLNSKVTRTIKYEYADGETAGRPALKAPVTQEATFTRTGERNRVTGVETFGAWTPATKELAQEDTPVVTGFVADKANVAAKTVTPDDKDSEEVVQYKKLGSYVPNVPDGLPKVPNLPYPNDPTDPTKPGTDLPMIPHVPGTTPVGPDGTTPLTPKDPSDPSKGYNPPPIPNDPTQDTPISYVKDGQKAIITFVDQDDNNKEVGKVVESGKSGEPIGTTNYAARLKELTDKGYEVVNDEFAGPKNFDNDNKKDQQFVVTLRQGKDPVTDPAKLNSKVTRTIKYEYADGQTDGRPALKAPVTQEATFTRTGERNRVTGEETFTPWTPATKELAQEDTPVVTGFVADKANVAAKTVTPDDKDSEEVVQYKELGSYVPNVPDGLPKVPNLPYPNDPTDPTKPGTDLPLIPHVPGTTPVGPDGTTPLTPKDPSDPSKGYNPPPIPNDPTQDTPISYVTDKQKAITNFVTENGKVVSTPVVDEGDSGANFTKSKVDEVTKTIEKLEKAGYRVVKNDFPSKDTDRVFDKDKSVDQIFNVTVAERIIPVTPGKPVDPNDPNLPKNPDGTPVTPSTPEPGKPVFPNDPNSPVWPSTVKDLVTEKSATRTIKYVDRDGKEVSETRVETIKFTRDAKVNLVTGEITYVEWTTDRNDDIFNGYPVPVVKGYIAKAGDLESSTKDIKVTPDTIKDINETVVYDKLGSWVPNIPGTPTNPIPYPNDPKDPTKPGSDKPHVPYVPGFTPVDPNGNPLKPVDPNDPTKGYEVPNIPSDPTKDTPINYVPVPQPTPTPVQPAAPSTPQYMDGQRELPNTGTEDNASLAALGLLGVLSGFGLVARKKKED